MQVQGCHKVPAVDRKIRVRLQEAYRLQWRCFLGLVYEQRHLPNLKALLKLYSSISLPKLASLMDGLDETAVRGQLILLKVTFSGPCMSW